MKTTDEILQALKTHLKEVEDQFALCEENEEADIEEIELSGRIDTLRWVINLFEEQ